MGLFDRKSDNLAEDGTNDPTDNKKLGQKIRRSRDYAPSTRVQTDSYRYFQEAQTAMLGAPYDVSKVPIDVLAQMKFDPAIAFAEHFITMPLLRARWRIECEDAQIAAFVDNSLRKIYASYLLERSQTHFYGFKPIVKRFQLENPDWRYLDPEKSDTTIPVWKSKNVEALTFKHFVGLPSDPDVVQPEFTASGDFDGIKYIPPAGAASGFPFGRNYTKRNNDGKERKIPAHLVLWATNQRHLCDGSLWGWPRQAYAYRYWFSYWLRWAMYDRYFERKSDPPYVVYYPTDPAGGEEDEDGASMKAHALTIGDAAKSGGTIALPGDFVTDFEGKVTANREWEIRELEIQGNIEHFDDSFRYLDMMKIQSLMVPDQAIRGNNSDSEQNFDVFKQSLASEMEQIDDEINRFIIPDLISANFPDRNVTARKVTTGFDDADLNTMMEIIRVVGQSDQNALKAVDFEQMLDTIGIPSINHDELVRREEKIKEEIDSAKPEPLMPIPGEQAGVDEEGFYVQPRERILLAEDTSFISKLPATKHYDDEKVLENARKIRAKWNVVYKDIYEDFASYIKKADLLSEEYDDNFADEDQATTLAYKIVSKWNFGRNKAKQLSDETKRLVKNVISRAGSRELQRIRTTEGWKPNTEAVATYLEERGALYVKAVDDTIKDEIASFLANQIRAGKDNDEIADAVREHFVDFPDWKADRLVRSEVRDAYNFATLEAGQQAGVKVVQAKDAQLGDTDEECIERNGNFYSIPQALTETLKEHPSGTLEWILIPDVNSVSEVTVNASELDDDEIGYYNNDTNTIYFSDKATDSETTQFKVALGQMLVYG